MDNFLTNKYFCLAIIIALGIMVYLYQTRDSCTIEGMDNVDLSMLAPELTDEPWAREGDDEKYRRYDSKFNKNADETVKENLKKKGYKYTNFLKGPGEMFEEYEKANNSSYPKPKDDHPELGACQPCNCNSDESEDTEEFYRRKMKEARSRKHKNSKR